MEISELIREYNRAGGYNDLSYRRTRADDVRFCSWAGQDDDGKKHQNNDNKEVFPWDGASDTRVRLADMVCTETLVFGGEVPGSKVLAEKVEEAQKG